MIMVRDADAGDIPVIMTIMNQAFEPAFGEAWTASQCASGMAMPGTTCLLAAEGARDLGFALYRRVLDEAELLLIAVRKSAQARGIGAAILREVIERLDRTGAKNLYLEMRDGNPAINFYERHQFTIAGRRRDYYRGAGGVLTDAISLRRHIA